VREIRLKDYQPYPINVKIDLEDQTEHIIREDEEDGILTNHAALFLR
jgi:hypothetical protein